MKMIGEAPARKLIEEFDALAGGSFHLWQPTVADFDLACAFVGEFATRLRGPDALHLAIARNNKADEFLTLDDDLLVAAKRLDQSQTRDKFIEGPWKLKGHGDFLDIDSGTHGLPIHQEIVIPAQAGIQWLINIRLPGLILHRTGPANLPRSGRRGLIRAMVTTMPCKYACGI